MTGWHAVRSVPALGPGASALPLALAIPPTPDARTGSPVPFESAAGGGGYVCDRWWDGRGGRGGGANGAKKYPGAGGAPPGFEPLPHHPTRAYFTAVLTAARAIYEKAGFKLVASEKHKSFGRELVGETWELTL